MAGRAPLDLAVVRGAWDVHVHAAPSHFPRWGDGWALAEACRDAGMAGFVLKSHRGSSVDAAAVLDRAFRDQGVRAFGGLVLNQFVGGYNPIAVESALALGAKIVWLPTIHGAHHACACGPLGGFGFQESPLARVPTEGLTLFAADGDAVRPEVKDIAAMCAERGAVLASGHASMREIRALVRFIADAKLDVKLMINHVDFKAPALSADELRELVALTENRVWFELCYISVSDLVKCSTFASTAALIRAVPDARFILASDSGQKANPPAPEALRRYVEGLRDEGLPLERLIAMMTTAPAELLGP